MTLSIRQQVHHARNPQEAMLAIAAALDTIIEKLDQPVPTVNAWSAWSHEPPITADAIDGKYHSRDETFTPTEQRAAELSFDEEAAEADISFKMPDAERLTARRAFERERLHLAEYLADDTQDWTEAYAMGGPMWLYLGNRDLVMSMPDSVRQAMVQDLIDTGAADDAHEMGRDILKQPCEDGPGSTAMHVGSGNVG